MLNFAVIMISQELEPLYARFHGRFKWSMSSVPYKAFAATRTIIILSCLRMLDCYGNVGTTFKAFGSIFTSIFAGGGGVVAGGAVAGGVAGGGVAGGVAGGAVAGFGAFFDGSMMTLGLDGYDYVILLLGMLTLFAVSMIQRKGSVRARVLAAPFAFRAALMIALLTAVIMFGAYGPGYDVGQFIYNRF